MHERWEIGEVFVGDGIMAGFASLLPVPSADCEMAKFFYSGNSERGDDVLVVVVDELVEVLKSRVVVFVHPGLCRRFVVPHDSK